MSSSEEIEHVVPQLRRFARAASGDKRVADLCVERALAGLLRAVTAEENIEGLSDHKNLYRVVEKELEAEAGGSFEKRAWRALILVYVEEFSVFEAGHILGIEAGNVKDMIASAEAFAEEVMEENLEL